MFQALAGLVYGFVITREDGTDRYSLVRAVKWFFVAGIFSSGILVVLFSSDLPRYALGMLVAGLGSLLAFVHRKRTTPPNKG